MKSILKKFAEITLVAILALGMFSCSNGSSDISDELQESTETTKETVATPTFSVAAGAVNSGTSVTITCATDGAKIYYTTDGTEPTASSTEYTAAISVTPPVTIKAIAVKEGLNNSAVANASYTVKGTVAMPVFSIGSSAVNSGTSVTITCATEEAKIYYTTDGSEPTASSTEYTAAISVTPPVTIKAIAVKEGLNNSAVASASYTIKTVATPTFILAENGKSVTISCATEGAKIYYTTNGSVPTASSTIYTAAISVTTAVTIKAIAVKDGMNDSAVSRFIIPTKNTCVPGDFVLKDGTMLPKDITLSDVQKSNVAAVIVRAAADGQPALGVGIVHNKSGLRWCDWDAAGKDIIIDTLVGDKTSGYMDGSNSWDLLVEACSDLKKATAESAESIETVAQKYPAFNYCRKYGTTNGLTGELATGWYLPTIAELDTIYQNKTAVDESLSKAGGDQFATGSYRSCCQHPANGGYVRFQNFDTGKVLGSPKNDSTRLCAVRAFN